MHRVPSCTALRFSPATLCSVGRELRRWRSDHPEQAGVSCGQETGVQGAQYIKGMNTRIGQGSDKVGKIEARRGSGAGGRRDTEQVEGSREVGVPEDQE